MDTLAPVDLQHRLNTAGIQPTLQRMAVASVLLAEPAHMTADQVLQAASVRLPGISRATVYAVLQLFVRQGLLKELPIDGAATVYDSNTAPHHHFYDVETGTVADIAQGSLQVLGLPDALQGLRLDSVDVIIRVRGLDERAADSARRRTAPAAGRAGP